MRVIVNESKETLKIERMSKGGRESEIPIRMQRSAEPLHYNRHHRFNMKSYFFNEKFSLSKNNINELV